MTKLWREKNKGSRIVKREEILAFGFWEFNWYEKGGITFSNGGDDILGSLQIMI